MVTLKIQTLQVMYNLFGRTFLKQLNLLISHLRICYQFLMTKLKITSNYYNSQKNGIAKLKTRKVIVSLKQIHHLMLMLYQHLSPRIQKIQIVSITQLHYFRDFKLMFEPITLKREFFLKEGFSLMCLANDLEAILLNLQRAFWSKKIKY